MIALVAVFSLSCDAILDLGIEKYAGKSQGEVTLPHQLADMFSPGDVLLADALMRNWRVQSIRANAFTTWLNW